MAKTKGPTMPAIDPFFREYGDRFIVLAGDGTPLAIVLTDDEETAARYGKAREPDCNSVICMAVLLSERLWSSEGREKISQLMGLPIIPSGTPGDPGNPESLKAAQAGRQGGYSNTYRRDFASAWRETARAIVGELNEQLKSLTVHKTPMPSRQLAIRPDERDRQNNAFMDHEAKMALEFAGAAA